MIDTLNTFLTWFTTLGSLGGVVLVIFVAFHLRGKFPGINTNWESGIVPSIAFLLFHLGLYWVAPQFWKNWFNSNGFMLMQILIVVGFYTVSFSTKTAQATGWLLLIVAFIGISLSIRDGYRALPVSSQLFAGTPPAPPATTSTQGSAKVTSIVVAPVAPAWSAPIDTPGEVTFGPELGQTIALRKKNGEIIRGITRNGGKDFGTTATMEFQSESQMPVDVTVIK